MTKSSKDLLNLQTEVRKNFKSEHLQTLAQLANGTFDSTRGEIFRAFKAAGANISNQDERGLRITTPLTHKLWNIAIAGHQIKLENSENALSEAARTVLQEATSLLESYHS